MTAANILTNKIIHLGGTISQQAAERYLELLCKHRTDAEEAEKNQIIKEAMTAGAGSDS